MIKKIDLETVEMIYNRYLVNDFPENEVKPLENIKTMWKMNGYTAYGYYDNEELKAYAFLCKEPSGKYVLLDYLAVIDKYRGQGIGSIVLKNLRTAMKEETALIIETEDADKAANLEEQEERDRRDLFYTRNGVIKTCYNATVYRADYRIWYIPVDENTDEKKILDAYQEIYRFMLSERGYSEFFKTGVVGTTNG